MALSKNKLDKLGKRITESKGHPNDSDIRLLQEYRMELNEPALRVFNSLRIIANKIDKSSIITFRLKRLDTIIRKLQRFEGNINGRMSLSTMSDIAGCRCIIMDDNIHKLHKLLQRIIKEYPSCRIKDYIQTPKEDGYKSIHIYVQEPISKKEVEIQIRTLTQHNWATLVEIIDLIYSKKIKEGEKEQRIQRLLLLFSTKNNLTYLERCEFIQLDNKIKLFTRMCSVFSRNFLNVRKQWISRKRNGNFYVFEATNEYKSSIDTFPKQEKAQEVYYEKYLNNIDSNIVMTYILNANFEQVSIAYSNYILSVHSFFDDYREIIESLVLESIINNNIKATWKFISLYRKTSVIYRKSLVEEVYEMRKCLKDSNNDIKRKKEWIDSLEKVISKQNKHVLSFIKRQSKEIVDKTIIKAIIKFHYRYLRFQINRERSKNTK